MLLGCEQYPDGKTCGGVHAGSDDLPAVVNPVGGREQVAAQGVIGCDQTIQIVRLIVDPYRGHCGAVLIDSHADNQTLFSGAGQRCQSDLSIAAAAARFAISIPAQRSFEAIVDMFAPTLSVRGRNGPSLFPEIEFAPFSRGQFAAPLTDYKVTGLASSGQPEEFRPSLGRLAECKDQELRVESGERRIMAAGCDGNHLLAPLGCEYQRRCSRTRRQPAFPKLLSGSRVERT
jgi:hypothetical protein